ncbi:MAG: choice-of-anchor Q domain-containing protein [Paludibacteraceae bacterium]
MKKINSLLVAVSMVISFSLSTRASNETVTDATQLATAITTNIADTILISGDFTISTELAIGRTLVIKGIDNPMLSGGGSTRFANVTSGALTIDGVRFSEFNAPSGDGGCLNISTTEDITIKNCTFLKCNVVNSTGGAIYIKPNTTTTAVTTTLINCVFSNCSNNSTTTSGYGGAVNVSASANLSHILNVYNCTFANNTGGRYGGNHVSIENGPDATFTNCVFFGGNGGKNYRNNDALNIRINSGASFATFVNCYIDSGTGYATSNTSNDVTLTNSNSDGGFFSGTLGGGKPLKWIATKSNGSAKFIQPSASVDGVDASTTNDALTTNYCIQEGSVLVDAGADISATTTTDILTNNRAYNGATDIGAYEFAKFAVSHSAVAGITIAPSSDADGDYGIYTSYTLTFSVPAGYAPEVSVTGSSHTLTANGGNNYLLTVEVTAATVITLDIVPSSIVTVTKTVGINTITSPTLNGGNTYISASSSTITFTINEGYKNPNIHITSGTATVSAITNNNDEYSVTLSDVSDDVSVTLTAIPVVYDYTITTTNATVITNYNATYTVEESAPGSIVFTLPVGYHLPRVIINGVSKETVKSGTDYTINTPTAEHVTSNTVITIYAYAENMLPVSEDTYIDGRATTADNSTSNEIRAQASESSYQRVAVLKFDATDIATNNYNKAVLRLVLRQKQKTYFETVIAKAATGTESFNTINWENNSAYYTNDNISPEVDPEVSVTTQVDKPIELDVTDYVFSNLTNNLRMGVTAGQSGTKDGAIYFHSFENGYAGYVPQLVFSSVDTITAIVAEGIVLVGEDTITVNRGSTHSINFSVDVNYKNPGVKINGTSYTLGEAVDGIYTINIPATTGNVKVEITCNVLTGLGIINSEDISIRYFTPQGVEVDKPIRGNIYIVKHGAKTIKIFYK